jgi:transmembrane sensor
MNLEKFIEIAAKVSDGSATADEQKQFNRYFNEYQQQYPLWDEVEQEEKTAIKQILGQRILQQIQFAPTPKRVNLWPRYLAAAIVLCILSFGIYFYSNFSGPKKTTAGKNRDLQAGGNRAFLTLSNGQKINLNDARNSQLGSQAGIIITKSADGVLIYKMKAGAEVDTGTNVIETPIGGQYRVELQDGTVVWLNASTSLKYPIRFSGKRRVVEIKGEAFFEVAHNAKMPFIVKSAKQEIEVLGTHFNVMAYADEAAVETTLTQGSVKITTPQNSLLLKPGQQAKTLATSAMLNPDADIENAVAWRMGKIQFVDMDIQHIMRMLSRWYNFEVDYKGIPTNTTFGGSFSRTKNLSVILKSLEATGDVHFILEGRRVTVMP